MKKHLLISSIILSLFTSVIAVAQPSFSATDLNPVVGDVYNIVNGGYMAQGNAGANQTWDFSTMTAGAIAPFSVVTPSSTGNAASFPAANIAIESTGSEQFFNASSSSLQYNGFYSTYNYTTVPYSNPEDMLRYPITYNNTYTDPLQGTYQSNGMTYNRSGTVQVTADGYGTVKTPAGTFNNVLRVHFLENYTDSMYYISVWIVYTYQTDEYEWYAKDKHYPVASIGTISGTSGGAQFGEYLSNITGVDEQAGVLKGYSVSPNPAADYISLDINLLSKQKIEVRIYNTIGALVKTVSSVDAMQGDNRYRIDLEGLGEGIYFSEVVLDDRITDIRKFVIAK